MTKILRSATLTVCMLALAACGDPDTNDSRGYTKAPLENPGWTIEGEEPTRMSELGEPNRIPSMDTAAIDTSDAAPASTRDTAPASIRDTAPASTRAP